MLESGFLTDRLSKIGFEWFKKSRFAKEHVCFFFSPLHASMRGELLKLSFLGIQNDGYVSVTPPNIHHYRSVLVSRQISGRQMILGDRSAEGFWEIPSTGHIKITSKLG